MPEQAVPKSKYYSVAAVLMLLFAATVAAYYLPLGRFGAIVALLIASAKAILVALFFMHLRYETGVTRLFSAGGLAWLAILIGLTVGDYLTRSEANLIPQG